MKALRAVGLALLSALSLASVALGGGLLMVALALRPLAPPLGCVHDHSS